MATTPPRFHRLTVREVVRQTPHAVSIVFTVPPELADDYAFEPGQYLTLRTTIDGEDLRRSYSICAGPDDGELRVAVKQVERGQFSSWVNASMKPGDVIEVMTPTGRFGAGAACAEGGTYVAFAAGSGITPVLSIVRGVLAREPRSRFFLFYGNRTTADILFNDELTDLKDRFLDRLSVLHVLSREAGGDHGPGPVGRLTGVRAGDGGGDEREQDSDAADHGDAAIVGAGLPAAQGRRLASPTRP